MNWLMMDMDAYFASVEQHLRRELRGRPVGVIPVETESTCIIAASYDAKRLGVKVGTGVREARQLCPDIVLVKARPKVYVEVHHQILASVDKCVPVHHVYSIDEWTVRLLGRERVPEVACELARRIKEQVRGDFSAHLTCSIGIAPTRLLAKIASNLQKPSGITLLATEDLPHALAHLKPKDLTGISRGMLARLERHGIGSVRELWELSRAQAIDVWGSVVGADWWAGFHGHDEEEAATRRRSMSHGHVLGPEFRNEPGARGILMRLVCKLGQRLRRDGYVARSLWIHVRGEYGESWEEDTGLPGVNDTTILLEEFARLWARRGKNAGSIKKVDVGVGGLLRASQVSGSLFEERERMDRVSTAIDAINDRFGSLKVYFGALHEFRHAMENKIAFGRIPDEGE